METTLTFEAFLIGLLTIAGISGAQGALLSIFLEWLPGYENLQPKTKRGVSILLCFAIPLGSILLMIAFGFVEHASQDLVFVALMNAWGVAFITNQGTHMVLYEGNGKGRPYDPMPGPGAYNAPDGPTMEQKLDHALRPLDNTESIERYIANGPRADDREDYKSPPEDPRGPIL